MSLNGASSGIKRSSSPSQGSNLQQRASKVRDAQGFRLRQQERDKSEKTAFDQMGGANNSDNTLIEGKTIAEEEAEGAKYVIDGKLRRVTPYYFTYLTYCKLRWRDRTLLDIFTDEFRDRTPEAYKRQLRMVWLV